MGGYISECIKTKDSLNVTHLWWCTVQYRIVQDRKLHVCVQVVMIRAGQCYPDPSVTVAAARHGGHRGNIRHHLSPECQNPISWYRFVVTTW